jgi:hypothetical protein
MRQPASAPVGALEAGTSREHRRRAVGHHEASTQRELRVHAQRAVGAP